MSVKSKTSALKRNIDWVVFKWILVCLKDHCHIDRLYTHYKIIKSYLYITAEIVLLKFIGLITHTIAWFYGFFCQRCDSLPFCESETETATDHVDRRYSKISSPKHENSLFIHSPSCLLCLRSEGRYEINPVKSTMSYFWKFTICKFH